MQNQNQKTNRAKSSFRRAKTRCCPWRPPRRPPRHRQSSLSACSTEKVGDRGAARGSGRRPRERTARPAAEVGSSLSSAEGATARRLLEHWPEFCVLCFFWVLCFFECFFLSVLYGLALNRGTRNPQNCFFQWFWVFPFFPYFSIFFVNFWGHLVRGPARDLRKWELRKMYSHGFLVPFSESWQQNMDNGGIRSVFCTLSQV